MTAQNLTPKMVRQSIQHYAVGKDQTTASRKGNKEDKMEVDRTHTEETSNQHYTTITYMEPPREDKKRKAKKHTWQRDTENERKKMGYTGKEIEKMATNCRSGGPWSMAYAPSKQTGQNKYDFE